MPFPADTTPIADAPDGTDTLGGSTPTHAEHHQALVAGVNSVFSELGANPSGSEADVAARFTAVEGDVATAQGDIVTAQGDIATLTSTVGALPGGDLRVFDAVSYGALVDGSTDDTVAWQDAIDACAAAGGGVVTSSLNGVSVIAGALQDTGGANAQLVLPSIHVTSGEQITVALRGLVPPTPDLSVIGAMILPDNHLVLKSTLASGTGAVIGVKGPSGSPGNLSNIHAEVSSLAVRLPSNPTNTAVDLRYAATVHVEEFIADVGTYDATAVTEPTTSTSFALRLPTLNNGARTTVEHVNVIGFYNGVEHSEHAILLDVNAWGCKVAYVPTLAYHASTYLRVGAYHCERGIKPTGAHPLDVWQFNIEHASTGWMVTDYDIDDASNYLTGNVRWWSVLAFSGPHNSFVKNGASGVTSSRIGDAPGSGSSGISVQDENGTAISGVTQLDFQGAGVTAASGTGEVVVTIPGGTDTEAVQDIIGAMVAAAGGSYNDGAGTITLPSGSTEYSHRDRLVAAAGNNTLTLGATPVAGKHLVWVNGTIKWPTTDYTISGAVITFVSALSASDVVLSKYESTTSTYTAAALTTAGGVNILDNFNRADTTSGIGTTSTGAKAWTQHHGTWGIASNRAYDSSGATATEVCTVDSAVADCTVSAKVYGNGAGGSRYFGVAGRIDSTGNNGYLVQINFVGGYIALRKWTSGVGTDMGATVPYSMVDGDVLELVMSGSTLTVKVNGTTMLTRTDSTYIANTRHGIWTYTDQGRFDDFSIQP